MNKSKKKDNSVSDWLRLGMDLVVDLTSLPYFAREFEADRLDLTYTPSLQTHNVVIVANTWNGCWVNGESNV